MKTTKKALLALVCAVALVFGSVFATYAYLTSTTDTVTNTFTVGKVGITLTETPNTDADGNGEAESWSAQLIPGKEYAKDPVVAVDRSQTSVDIYLFVKFEENNNPSTYLEYTSNLTTTNGWTLVEGENGVWYRTVDVEDATIEWHLLKDDKVTVRTTLTKESMPKDTPELKYTAYAVQSEGIADTNNSGSNVDEAWAIVNPAPAP